MSACGGSGGGSAFKCAIPVLHMDRWFDGLMRLCSGI